MATLKKKALSHFLRTNCKRRLRLELYPTDKNEAAQQERNEQGNMPPPDTGRLALAGLTQAGREWEDSVFEDLISVFNEEVLFSRAQSNRFSGTDLLKVLKSEELPRFIIEPSFSITQSFKSQFGLDQLSEKLSSSRGSGLNYSTEFRPDIIEFLSENDEHLDEYCAMSSDGKSYKPSKELIGLRVIDIKLAASPSVSYFAEVALYSMILASWLDDNHLADRFYVSIGAAVWPGKHSGTSLGNAHYSAIKNRKVLTSSEATSHLRDDLSILPKDIYTSRVQEFLINELPEVLLEEDWQNLPWHVSPVCMGCEYLGYKWSEKTKEHKEYCWPKALREGSLSQVFGLTHGASAALRDHSVQTVDDLTKLRQTDRAFDSHYTLKASRSVIHDRASVLGSNAAVRALRSSNSLLPKSADINILIGVEFDISSGITLALSWKAWTNEPQGGRIDKKSETFVVREKSNNTERSTLILWLKRIADYLARAQSKAPPHDLSPDSTFQIYLWDETSFTHLKRIIARHLPDILNEPQDLVPLSWMFPSDEVLPEPKYAKTSRPLSIVKTLILQSVCADIPFHYNISLLAAQYRPKNFDNSSTLSLNNFYNDPLSDHIPSERAHDIWTGSEKKGFHYLEVEEQVKKVCKQKLDSLDYILMRANKDFETYSRPTPPPVKLMNRTRVMFGVSPDSELWYSFTKLNDGLQQFEVDRLHSLDVYEQEARFYSVRLDRQLESKEAKQVKINYGVRDPEALVFEVSHRSRDSKVKVDSLGYSLLPECLITQAGYRLGYFFKQIGVSERSHPAIFKQYKNIIHRLTLRDVFGVTVKEFDRDSDLIIVSLNEYHRDLQEILISHGVVDFTNLKQSNRAIIQPIHLNFAVKRIEKSLKAIGAPPLSLIRPLISIPSSVKKRKKRQSPTSTIPCESFIWDAAKVAQLNNNANPQNESLKLSSQSSNLDQSQRAAISEIASKRLSLIWGPPGTGKTTTLATALYELCELFNKTQKNPVRILVTAHTWVAIDTLCKKFASQLSLLSSQTVRTRAYRLKSSSSPQPVGLGDNVEVVSNKPKEPSLMGLVDELKDPKSNAVVFATPQQTFNLRKVMTSADEASHQTFDHIIVDEASQLDLSNMMMVFPSFADNCSLTVVGDDKQMAPVLQTELPKGAEHQMGSIFKFYSDYWNIQRKMLEISYRSNKEIVDFVRQAGYRDQFKAHKESARMKLATFPTSDGGHWLNLVLDPNKPLICITHDDDISAQCSELESGLTVSILSELLNNLVSEDTGEPYTVDEFFTNGVGIVTPHIAQKSRICADMHKSLNASGYSAKNLYESVDTVERFQGQEKDVIIASYALSDRDSILQEEDFIFGLERFNVAVSRAKKKVIVIVSKELVKHIPRDIEVVEASRLLKLFASNYLNNSEEFKISGDFKARLEVKYN